jgi:hypothetical protein
MTRRNSMYYLVDFARPQGAKDKEPRKRRGTLGNLVIGTGVGAIGGAGAGKYLSEKLIYDVLTEEAIKDGSGKNPTEVRKIINQTIKKDKTGKVKKEFKKLKWRTFKDFAPKTIATGAGLGLIGTGAYLGGKALVNKGNNKSSSPQN